jgi:hypothetical protein
VRQASVKSRLLGLLVERRQSHRHAANDMRRKLGERVDAQAKARECEALRQIVQALPDEGSNS